MNSSQGTSPKPNVVPRDLKAIRPTALAQLLFAITMHVIFILLLVALFPQYLPVPDKSYFSQIPQSGCYMASGEIDLELNLACSFLFQIGVVSLFSLPLTFGVGGFFAFYLARKINPDLIEKNSFFKILFVDKSAVDISEV